MNLNSTAGTCRDARSFGQIVIHQSAVCGVHDLSSVVDAFVQRPQNHFAAKVATVGFWIDVSEIPAASLPVEFANVP